VLIGAGGSLNIAAQEDRPDLWLGIDAEKPIDQIDEQVKWLKSEKELGPVESRTVQTQGQITLAFGVGDTPLHSAAHSGRINIVTYLIKAKAEIDRKNSHGQTPLHYAIAFKHPRIVECLLKAGANPKTKMNDGTTAIELAGKVNDKQIIDLLKAK
jgi:hypothetical protein